MKSLKQISKEKLDNPPKDEIIELPSIEGVRILKQIYHLPIITKTSPQTLLDRLFGLNDFCCIGFRERFNLNFIYSKNGKGVSHTITDSMFLDTNGEIINEVIKRVKGGIEK